MVVVSGLPRSGTSLMMSALGAAGMPLLVDGVRRCDEDNPEGYFEYEPVRRLAADSSWVAGARGRAVKVVSALLRELPRVFSYRVLFMERRLGQILASQRKMLERRGAGNDLDDAAVRASFERHLRDVRAWLATRRNFETLRVDYEEMVADPGTMAGRVAAFLGGGLDAAAMAQVVRPDLFRNRG